MIENLLEYYRKSNSAIKKKILGSNSDKKLIFGEKKVATLVFTEPVQLILRISEDLGSSKESVSVSVSLEEKEASVLALAHTLTLFLVPRTDKSCNRLGD